MSISSTGGPDGPAAQPNFPAPPAAPPQVTVVSKTTVDLQHIGIVLAFVVGVVYGAKSLVMTIAAGHTPPMSLVGAFVTLTVTAVAAFLKDKPGSWQVAFIDGTQTDATPPPPAPAEKTT